MRVYVCLCLSFCLLRRAVYSDINKSEAQDLCLLERLPVLPEGDVV